MMDDLDGLDDGSLNYLAMLLMKSTLMRRSKTIF
jgi:hypothetical protein